MCENLAQSQVLNSTTGSTSSHFLKMVLVGDINMDKCFFNP